MDDRLRLCKLRDGIVRFLAMEDDASLEALLAIGEEFMPETPPTRREMWHGYALLLKYPFWTSSDEQGMMKLLDHMERRWRTYETPDRRVSWIRTAALHQVDYEKRTIPSRTICARHPTSENFRALFAEARKSQPHPAAVRCACKNLCTCIPNRLPMLYKEAALWADEEILRAGRQRISREGFGYILK
ncbi:hypothetical protein HY642_04545 [Candidatus Woesearchaeota archaeon]|nr:hypothetical protein [Candidatus Woesearchaeota archaeon]